MTKGPYATTGSAMGRPCSNKSSTASGPASTATARSLRSTISRAPVSTSPSIRTDGPRKKYSVRFKPGLAAGNVQRAPAASAIVQIATSASGFAAHESRGGAGGT